MLTPHHFALLDDRVRGVARLYRGLRRVLTAGPLDELEAVWEEAERALAAGERVVFFADYDWGAKLQKLPLEGNFGVVAFFLFESMTEMASTDAIATLATSMQVDEKSPAGLMNLKTSIEKEQCAERIRDVHRAIERGETYQINFTYKLIFSTYGHPLVLYQALAGRQPAPYCALLHLPLPKRDWILSFSPELFLRKQGAIIEVEPMKGTAKRGATTVDDENAARWLKQDAKNRAENLMIVDLIRNDLGRIARVGGVKVPALFEIRSLPTVHQMVSRVTAELGENCSFPRVFEALFPCGSITGAPKRQTMKWIRTLEGEPRGIYTGAIGWIDRSGCGKLAQDYCLSVAIRTLELNEQVEEDGLREGRMGVGGGIVIDSRAEDEWKETEAKVRFVTEHDPGFQLLETMDAVGSDVPWLQHHLARLRQSAQSLGFRFSVTEVIHAVESALSNTSFPRSSVRVCLSKSGAVLVESKATPPPLEEPVTLGLSEVALAKTEVQLCSHKTTYRPTYSAAMRSAEAAGAFDYAFFNHHGQVTEGARSNILIRLKGDWITPPVESGVLPGIARERALSDPRWDIRERPISRSELLAAEEIVVCNALRGYLKAVLRADTRFSGETKDVAARC